MSSKGARVTDPLLVTIQQSMMLKPYRQSCSPWGRWRPELPSDPDWPGRIPRCWSCHTWRMSASPWCCGTEPLLPYSSPSWTPRVLFLHPRWTHTTSTSCHCGRPSELLGKGIYKEHRWKWHNCTCNVYHILPYYNFRQSLLIQDAIIKLIPPPPKKISLSYLENSVMLLS